MWTTIAPHQKKKKKFGSGGKRREDLKVVCGLPHSHLQAWILISQPMSVEELLLFQDRIKHAASLPYVKRWAHFQ